MDFPNNIRIDLKLAVSVWEKGAITSSEKFDYKSQVIKVCNPEYLIMNKIFKGSRIDIEDAYSVYFQNKSRLNFDVMLELAKYFQIEKEFKIFLERKQE